MLDKKQLTVRLPQSTVDYLSQKAESENNSLTADERLVNSVTETNAKLKLL